MSFRERKHQKENVVLANKVNAGVDLVTGELTASIFDINTGGTVLPVGVSHVLKKDNPNSTTDYKCGNFRLNLHQRLKEITSETSEKDYVFIDELGEKHDFQDKYYYLDSSGTPQFIDKNVVKIGLDGKLTYEIGSITYEVKKDQRTSSGLVLESEIKDFIGSALLETKHEEILNAEEEIKQRKINAKQIKMEYMSLKNDLRSFILNYKQQISTRISEIDPHKPSDNALATFNDVRNAISNMQKDYNQLIHKVDNVSMRRITATQGEGANATPVEIPASELVSNKDNWENYGYPDYNISGGFAYEDYDGRLADDYSYIGRAEQYKQDGAANGNDIHRAAMYFQDRFDKKCETLSQSIREWSYTLEEKNNELQNEYTIQSREDSYELQKDIMSIRAGEEDDNGKFVIKGNMDILQTLDSLLAIELELNDKKLIHAKHSLADLKRQIPVDYLSDKNGLIRGFNNAGRLVLIYDNYENYASITWDDEDKIIAAYDSEEKGLTFTYKNNLLTEISSDNGKYVKFSYTSNQLTRIDYSSDESIVIGYENNQVKFTSSTDQIEGVVTFVNDEISRTDKVSKIENISLVGEIKHGHTGLVGESINKIDFTYENNYMVLTHKDSEEYYYFDTNGDVIKKFVKRDDVFKEVALIKQVDDEYILTVQLKKQETSSMVDTIVDPTNANNKLGNLASVIPTGYTLAEADWEYTIIDELGNPKSTLTNFQKISTDKYAKSVTIYDYDDNQQLKQKSSKTIYSPSQATTDINAMTVFNNSNEKAQIEKNFYNSKGAVVETWSYVEGEEQTSGINISETVYDKKGNVKKSFTYNSLDSSSKFYDEKECAENGRLIADIDETGEHKTLHDYDETTGEVQTTTTPNGSKFSYGRDTNTGEITSITQSTEEGEANTTNTLYTNGCLTELNSAANKINYEYDAKRRKKAVLLNDEKYVNYEYAEDVVVENKTFDKLTATFAKDNLDCDENCSEGCINEHIEQCVVETLTDKEGNVISAKIDGATQFNNTYNSDNNITQIEDCIAETSTSYEYNNLDKVSRISTINDAVEVFKEEFDYNNDGQLSSHAITADGVSSEYNFTYKDNFAKELDYITLPTGAKSKTDMDVNGRVKAKELSINNGKKLGDYISYRKVGDHATNMVSSIRYGEVKQDSYVIKDGLKYTYDNVGNITQIHENGKLIARYSYDKLNRLIREDNAKFNKTYVIEYDNNGNILSKQETNFTLNENLLELTSEKQYTYDAKRPDQLKFVGNAECVYDSIGNPKVYKGDTLTWTKDRQLASWEKANSETITFGYDGFGKRISKGRTSYTYTADGKLFSENRLIPECDIFCGEGHCGDEATVLYSRELRYLYDEDSVIGFVYNNLAYYYRKNLQGDVTKLFDSNGILVAQYEYDAWGNHKVYDADGVENNEASFIGNINPIRYRSYYFDTELKLYWLQTRFYDSSTGRFINADAIAILETAKDYVNGLNLFAYCFNNPVMDIDPTGEWSWKKFWRTLAVVVIAVVVVVAVAAITVASGGTLAPVLIGAAIGATAGFGTSVATQLVSNGWDFSNIDWGAAFVSMSIGMVAGAFGGSGLGKVGMGIANSLTSAGGSIASDIVAGNGIDVGGAVFAGILGAVMGGRKTGAQFGKMTGRKAIQTTLNNLSSRSGRGIAGLKTIYNNKLIAATSTLNSTAIPTVVKMQLGKIGGHLVRNLMKVFG